MKLSELIQKIYDTNYKSECWVEYIKDPNDCYHKIRIQYGDGYWGDYEFYIRNNKIEMSNDMYLLPMNEFKWLYRLWLDEVIIEDDVEE